MEVPEIAETPIEDFTDDGEIRVLKSDALETPRTSLNPVRPHRSSRDDPFSCISCDHESKAFRTKLDDLYPGAMHYEEAAVLIKHVLRRGGFRASNSIALVAQCRDEIAKPFVTAIDHNWLGSFNVSSLAGSVFCGKTGFTAAIHHAPIDSEGIERYVVFCGPHIAIDEHGVVGRVVRRGRRAVSSACGALIAFQAELESGVINVEDVPLDGEFSALKRRLLHGLTFGQQAPDLAELTRTCLDCSLADVRNILAAIDEKKCEYAIVGGTLIHGPEFSHYFQPTSIDVVRNGSAVEESLMPVLKAAQRPDYVGEMKTYLSACATDSHRNADDYRCSECEDGIHHAEMKTPRAPPVSPAPQRGSGASTFCSVM